MNDSDQGASPSSLPYYSDPLEAAYMAKHHGMVFLSSSDGEIQFSLEEESAIPVLELITPMADNYGWVPTNRAYIHPDSLHLLEPKVGDLYLITEPDDDAILHNVTVVLDNNLCEKWRNRPTGEIIRRDGKAFHWPKSEAV